MSRIQVGRQPVYNGDRQIEAFELLHRVAGGGGEVCDMPPPVVLLQSLEDIGLDPLVGTRNAYLRMPLHSLLLLIGQNEAEQPVVLAESHGRLVWLIDEPASDDELALLPTLRERGLRLALDQFTASPAGCAALAHVEAARLNWADGPDVLTERLRPLADAMVTAIAVGIDQEDDFARARAMGFDGFQGGLFERPVVVDFDSMPTGRLAIVQLLAALHNPEVSIKTVEQLISRDASLSYKLLRQANSAYFALPRRVQSIAEAVVRVGLNRIRLWATLISLADIDDRGQEWMLTALIRGRMCEELALRTAISRPETAFTVGLLSILDQVVPRPIGEIIAQLPLDPAVVAALVDRSGLLGALLRCTLAYEQGNWTVVDASAMDPDVVGSAYAVAINHAYQATRDII